MTYDYSHEAGLEVPLVCELNFTPEERQTYEYPGCPACMELVSATVNGVDISSLLKANLIDTIESLALAKHGADAQEAAAERQIEAWQLRSYG